MGLLKTSFHRYMVLLAGLAASKAAGEKALTDACSDELMTIAAPTRCMVLATFSPTFWRPTDGVLRIFASSRTGYGMNRVCFTRGQLLP